MDCSRPGSSVHGISQARIQQWVAFSLSRGSSLPREEPGSSALLVVKNLPANSDLRDAGLIPRSEDFLEEGTVIHSSSLA